MGRIDQHGTECKCHICAPPRRAVPLADTDTETYKDERKAWDARVLDCSLSQTYYAQTPYRAVHGRRVIPRQGYWEHDLRQGRIVVMRSVVVPNKRIVSRDGGLTWDLYSRDERHCHVRMELS